MCSDDVRESPETIYPLQSGLSERSVRLGSIRLLRRVRSLEMSNSSSNALSIIVGGASGMGLATARLLAAGDSSLLLVGRDRAKLAKRKSELESESKAKVE